MSIVDFLNFAGTFQFAIIWSIIGIGVCKYAIYIESEEYNRKKNDGKKIERLCDVNDWISCTAVLNSEYSHMTKMIFGLNENSMFNWSNAHYGLVFYIGLLFFHFYPLTLLPYHEYLFLIATIGSVVASCGLAYILRYILHQLCLICVFMYIVNAFLFTSSVMRIVNMP
jgi:vitamin-K-epoxide reductase (warfarin-sensitive)